ncbi:MAG TPA: DUF423 domain-containing protein [Candidatus Methylacidiphilales bacterium]|nr:DUF423 domain-containing protein [Candidatus Methylacidiphilales bacterium]
MSFSTQQAVACIFAVTAVILGALGAHGPVHEILIYHTPESLLPKWETAVFYHLTHSIVLLVLARTSPRVVGPFVCFMAGILLFSGSLYIYGFTGVKILGAITPFGGLCLMAGWIWLAFSKPTS